MTSSSNSTAKMNWSKIVRPSPPPPPQPQPQPTPSQSPSKSKKRKRRNRKSAAQNANEASNSAPSNNARNGTDNQSQNGKMSFAALTAQTKSFVTPKQQYNTLSVPSSHQSHTSNDNQYGQINKEALRRRDEQRQSALLDLKNGWSNQSALRQCTIYGVRNRGIVNRNVDCYINAIIQCLLSLPLIVTIFSDINDSRTATTIGPFTRALYDVVRMFSVAPSTSHQNGNNSKKKKNGKNSKSKSNTNNHRHKGYEELNDIRYANINHPSSLVEILDKFRRSIGRQGNGQQDAQEFLGYIIAHLHDEMTWNFDKSANGTHTSSVSSCTDITSRSNSRHPVECKESDHQLNEVKASNVDNGFNSNQLNTVNSADVVHEVDDNSKGWTLVTKNLHRKTTVAHRLRMKQSLICTLFGGEYYQMIRRANKRMKPSVSYQPFFSISLDIHDHRIRSVHQALQSQFCMQHEIEYRGGTAKKSELISDSPFYLILHLKRFLFAEGQMYKVHKYIGYDVSLTVPPHILFNKKKMKAGRNGNKLQYQLRSVLVHSGDFVTHGHYTSYCRREDFYVQQNNRKKRHQWYMFDDSTVKTVDVKTVKSQQAYVLVYQKVL